MYFFIIGIMFQRLSVGRWTYQPANINHPIRCIFEVNAWLKAALMGETGYILYLAATMQLQTELMIKKWNGGGSAAPVRLLLPSGMTSTTTGITRWDSGGTNLPAGVPPLQSEEEEELVSVLIRELNSKLRLGLDPSPNLDPEVVGGGGGLRPRGSSSWWLELAMPNGVLTHWREEDSKLSELSSRAGAV